MHIKSRLIFLALILVLAVTLTRPYRAAAATMQVNVYTDAYDESTRVFCSLRMAVVAANENRQVGACPAGSATQMDSIVLAPGLYQLDIDEGTNESDTARSGDLDITESLSISGYSAESTIIQGATFEDRIFHINTTGNVVLKNLTITKGKALTGLYKGVGGGILNQKGSLAVDSVVITANDAANAGGGVANIFGASLLVTGSSIQSNTSGSGGGIHNNGNATVRNSLIFDNRANSTGGGFVNNLYSTAVLTNVTISTNQADIGSGIFSQSDITITNNTIAKNIRIPTGTGVGAGLEIAPNSKGSIANTIIAFHEFNCGTPIGNNPAYFYSKGGNLENKNNCLLSAHGELFNKDPGMAVNLGTDFGGKTKYYALVEGSSAVNTGSNASCAGYDQRGIFFSRKDGKCDIGSFEFGAVEEILTLFLPAVQR
jgi:hypothetical protein